MTTTNTLKTVALLAVLTGLLVLIGRAIGGTGGMMVAFGLAVVMNVGSYWFSDRIALSMSGAREVGPEQAPELHRMVEQLARSANLPKPRVYLIETDAANAFATGRDPSHSAVAATTGIMRILSYDELAGVMAHELAHIKNRDILVSSIVATIAGAIGMIAQMAQWALIFGGFGGRSDEEEEGGGLGGLVGGLALIIVAPIIAMIIQFAVSRVREYGADAGGAEILGDPLPLASALEKLHAMSFHAPLAANPGTAHMYIVNPLAGATMAGLFSTHPPVEERIARLRDMSLRQTMRPRAIY